MASYQSEMVSPEWICSMVYILLLLILVLWRQIIGTHYTTCCSTCLFRFLLCMLDHLTCWTVGESIYTYPYVYLPAHWCALTLVQSCNTLVISRWQCLSMPLRTRNHGRLKSWTANSFAVRNFQHTCTLVIWGAAKTSFFFLHASRQVGGGQKATCWATLLWSMLYATLSFFVCDVPLCLFITHCFCFG